MQCQSVVDKLPGYCDSRQKCNDRTPSFVYSFLKRHTQEAWLMHISKFFCLIIIHGNTFSMHA